MILLLPTPPPLQDAYNNTYGALISTDDGRDWIMKPWPVELNDFTTARYGAFPSDQVQYIVGGQWPAPPAPPCPDPPCVPLQPRTSRTQHGSTCLSLSRMACIELGAKGADYVAANNRRLFGKRWDRKAAGVTDPSDHYAAVITYVLALHVCLI